MVTLFIACLKAEPQAFELENDEGFAVGKARREKVTFTLESKFHNFTIPRVYTVFLFKFPHRLFRARSGERASASKWRRRRAALVGHRNNPRYSRTRITMHVRSRRSMSCANNTCCVTSQCEWDVKIF